MKALCWNGIKNVAVETVPDPEILNPRDAIVRVTRTAICGSDLHLYHGYIPAMKPGDILGHEFMGEVVEVGSEVRNLSRGDRVVVPFPIACGACFFCGRSEHSLCDNTNPNAGLAEKLFGHSPAGIFGYSHLLGGYAGGQAEYVRVPHADVGPMKVPDGVTDEQALMLADVFPTGWQAAEYCNIQPGDVVAVWGCGPVGLFAIASAKLLGAERVIAIETERIEKDRMLEVIARDRDVELNTIAKDREVEVEKRNIAEVVRERVVVEKTVVEQEEAIKRVQAVEEANRLKESAIIAAEAEAQENLVKDIKVILDECGMAPELLELEVSETVLARDTRRTLPVLTALKKLGVKIIVDDEVRCEESPCKIEGLKPGSYVVRAEAEGFQDLAGKAFEVEDGAPHAINLEMTPDAGTGIKGSSSGPELTLSIDGKEIGPLPQDVTPLEPGEHVVELAGSQYYKPFRKTVALKKGQTLELRPELELEKGKVAIKLDSSAEEAEVTLVVNGKRRFVDQTLVLRHPRHMRIAEKRDAVRAKRQRLAGAHLWP